MSIKQEIQETIEVIEAAKAAGDMVEAAYWHRQLALLRQRESIYDEVKRLADDSKKEYQHYKEQGRKDMADYVSGLYRGLIMALHIVEREGEE